MLLDRFIVLCIYPGLQPVPIKVATLQKAELIPLTLRILFVDQ